MVPFQRACARRQSFLRLAGSKDRICPRWDSTRPATVPGTGIAWCFTGEIADRRMILVMRGGRRRRSRYPSTRLYWLLSSSVPHATL